MIKSIASLFFMVFLVFAQTTLALESLEDLKPELIENEQITLGKLLPLLLEKHERIQSAKIEVEAERERVKVELGKWYPELEISLILGTQEKGKQDDAAYFNEMNLKLTQLLWDFGATNAEIKQAYLKLQEKELTLTKVTQQFLLDAASNYVSLVRAHQILQFALESEKNIRQQADMEEVRVEEGAGYSTDVLQSKTQLAGAISRRLRNQGTLMQASNDFRETFGWLPDNLVDLETFTLEPPPDMQESLKSQLQLADEKNLTLRLQIIKQQLAQQGIELARAKGFTPKIKLTLENKLEEDVRGTRGRTSDFTAKVEVKMPFNLGFTSYNKLRASELDSLSKTHQVSDERRVLENKTRNSWQKLETAKATASSLEEQAQLSAEFLKLARIERELGNRSLIDILSGETSLINAQSDAASARVDITLALLSLIEIVGALELPIFTQPDIMPSTE